MFHVLDWLVLGGYLLAVVALGAVFSRRSTDSSEFFLAGRSMPVWAVAISVLATSQSAATFVGGPELAYRGDLTYLSATLGALVGMIVAAVFFVPAFYRYGVTSIYELLGSELGTVSQRSASGMFMLGRVFASGARLFIVAIPFSLIAFGRVEPHYLVLSIVVIAAVATGYTLAGGIRAVIWTDVLQAAVYIGTVGIAVWLLWSRIPLGPGALIDALRETGDGGKLRIIDTGFSLTRPYNLWAVILGFGLFNLAAYGTDQDLAQRLLTCRTPARASWSLMVANLLSVPVVFLFLVAGLLLYVYYQRPDIMGAAAPGYVVDDSRRVFVEFVLHEMPVGLRGLMMAGLFAAAMSSLDSALTAMASTTVADFYRPIARVKRSELRVCRVAVVAWSVVLTLFACVCAYWQSRSDVPLVDFALGVMVFAYSGLLAVFLTALFTRRGNSASAVAALLVGFASTLALRLAATLALPVLSFGWQMLLATSLSFAVCCMGARTSRKP